VPKDPYSKFRSSQFLASSSTDGAKTWSPPEPISIPHKYVVGKIHAPVWMDEKTVVMGYSWDVPAQEGMPAGSEGQMFLKSGVLISQDSGRTWTPGGDVTVNIHPIGADEPAIVRLGNGELFMILRTSSPHPYETASRDGGKTWDPPSPSSFFGYNSPSALLRLRDGAILRAWDNSPTARFPLVVSLSTDDCQTWSPPRIITEPTLDAHGKPDFERACYPSLAEAADGTILAVWWERTVEGVNSLGYARFNRAWVAEARALPRPRTLVSFGDSVTAGVGRCGVANWQTYSFLLEYRLKVSGIRVEVLNMGVGGNNTRDGLKRLDRDVLAHKPALVVVMFGANDAAMVDAGPKARTEPRVPLGEYKANLTQIVRRTQTTGATVVLCTPPPMSRAYAYSKVGAYATHEDMNFMLREYAAAAREVARETGATLVDSFRIFTERPDGLELIQDGCHPNAAGQALIADVLSAPVRKCLTEREAESK
jgi:lysophospholipase L1-like esterase